MEIPEEGASRESLEEIAKLKIITDRLLNGIKFVPLQLSRIDAAGSISNAAQEIESNDTLAIADDRLPCDPF